uniref:ATP-grasp domain-containing protein n=1 Tax=Marseillevirus LCMAC201 TaxID=2506605 RepID=A0A481YVF3_9VIRU|nr:MAG: protein of unknown function DUF4343 [Marseillevirus LCMAC201]
MSIIIQNTWNDDDDEELYEYLDTHHIKYDTKTEQEILKLNPYNIEILFCDTNILQELLNTNNISFELPNQYPQEFSHIYHRNICKSTFCKSLSTPIPYFIKPVDQNKLFGGVVYDKYDINFLKSLNILDDYPVYISDVVQFVNEYRIFVANKKSCGIIETSHFILPPDIISSKFPPIDFINTILELNPYKFCVIDIGMLNSGEWAVVEVNPSFSLSSYEWDIEKYVNYCKLYWNYTLYLRN